MKNIPILSVSAIAVFFSCSLQAEVSPNPLFTDGAVLQRGQPVPVWGTARDGEKVTVEFAGQSVGTTAADGKWSVRPATLTEFGPFAMTLAGGNRFAIKSLLVGEVRLDSGQSNIIRPFSNGT